MPNIIPRKTLIGTTLLPAAMLMTIAGTAVSAEPAFAGVVPSAGSGAAVRLAGVVPSAVGEGASVGGSGGGASLPGGRPGEVVAVREVDGYTMRLSSTAATVRPGGVTTTVISFRASRRLYGAPVDLSVSGLPAGATASFSPPRPLVGGHSTLTIVTAPSSPVGAFSLTVSAIVHPFSSDPIGTSTDFALTVE
jgi:hypothetical protein